jgi:hypothetical protein
VCFSVTTIYGRFRVRRTPVPASPPALPGKILVKELFSALDTGTSLDKIAHLPVEQQRRVASKVKLPDENSNCYA